MGYYEITPSIGDLGSFVKQQSNAEGITIESYQVYDRSGSQSRLPHFKDSTNAENSVMEKINNNLLDQFFLQDYAINPQGYDFSEINFSSELNEQLAFLSCAGFYRGRSISAVQRELYFDLSTGEEIVFEPIGFHTYLNKETYSDFLTEYWLEEVNIAFGQANACAGAAPYCSKFNIASYDIAEGQISFSLTSDCFPDAVASCSPTLTATAALSELDPYLSALGKSAMVTDSLWAKTGLEKYTYLVSNEQLIKESAWDLASITSDM